MSDPVEKEETKLAKRIRELEQEKAQKESKRLKLAQEAAKLGQEIATIEERLALLKVRYPNEVERGIGLLKSGVFTLDEILKEYFPDLLESPAFWQAFLEAKDEFPLLWPVWELLEDNAPAAIINNKDLMLGLCSYDAEAYCAIPRGHQLRADEEIVKVVLEACPSMLCDLPGAVQLEHPHLVGAALARLPLWQERRSLNFSGLFGSWGVEHSRDRRRMGKRRWQLARSDSGGAAPRR